MALTISKLSPNPDFVAGNKRVKFRDITFDSSYPTGGEALTAADVGLKHISYVSDGNAAAAAGTTAVNTKFDYTNNKLQAYETAGTVDLAHKEVTSTADLSALIVRVMIIGW